jgi:hypothetical protein
MFTGNIPMPDRPGIKSKFPSGFLDVVSALATGFPVWDVRAREQKSSLINHSYSNRYNPYLGYHLAPSPPIET